MQGGVHHWGCLGVVLAGPEGEVLLKGIIVALCNQVQRVSHQLTRGDITWKVPQLSLSIYGCCNAHIMRRDDLQAARSAMTTCVIGTLQ